MDTPDSRVTSRDRVRRGRDPATGRTPRAIAARCFAITGAVLLVLVIAAEPMAQPDAGDSRVRIAALQAEIGALDPRVALLKARQDILDASMRYARGADRHDRELVRSAFWADASISYGTPMTRDEFVDWQEGVFTDFAAHQHHVTGQTVEFDGDTAHVETYLLYFLVPRDRSIDAVGAATPGRALESENTRLGSGRFVERWERRDGEWKILVREYIEDLALEGATVDICGSSSGCIGAWNRNDPSYMRPLEHLTPEQRRTRADAGRRTRHPLGAAANSGSGR